ncbi:MAG: 3-deoxy-7-phosphoheptulonate synthase [Phycisphaerae bacterium]|nr:3-deoxy-7-phosphoheptulonate synthase [Phycisphaerae bacterium]
MSKAARHSSPGWGASKPREEETAPVSGWAVRQRTENLNVTHTIPLVCPRELKTELPMTLPANRTVVESRDMIRQILGGFDRRLLVVIGPCSIHDEKAALEYAGRLCELSRKVSEQFFVVMRVYFEKPRTTIGWKGLINDPLLDGSFAMETGLRKARRLLLAITEMGLPTATEMLDPITPQYIADLISWASLGARTTESQTHRQMASGLSMPVGYKNSTEGNLQVAIDAMQSARHAHSFLGIDDDGRTAIIKTRGNRWGHMILRGGRNGPNYDPKNVADATARLRKACLPAVVMVDCSHANSNKKFQNQELVWRSVLEQQITGNPSLIGLLVESNLCEGSQPFIDDPTKLRYGVSITDECLGWEKTEEMLLGGAKMLKEAASRSL